MDKKNRVKPSPAFFKAFLYGFGLVIGEILTDRHKSLLLYTLIGSRTNALVKSVGVENAGVSKILSYLSISI